MPTLIGRNSSHYTRVVRIFAHELKLPLEIIPVYDIAATDPAIFGGNPALKVPSLVRPGNGLVFGTENVVRTLAQEASEKPRIVWPEQLTQDVSRNAQEMVWHAMSAQVNFVLGTMVSKLPSDNPFFSKGRLGFEGSLRWLNDHLDAALAALPKERDFSLFEVTLFCLIEHLPFRGSLPIDPYPRLVSYARDFAERPSAKATPYSFDVKPQ